MFVYMSEPSGSYTVIVFIILEILSKMCGFKHWGYHKLISQRGEETSILTGPITFLTDL